MSDNNRVNKYIFDRAPHHLQTHTFKTIKRSKITHIYPKMNAPILKMFHNIVVKIPSLFRAVTAFGINYFFVDFFLASVTLYVLPDGRTLKE